MRRTIGGLSALAAACGVAMIACLGVGSSFMARSRLFGDLGPDLTQAQVEKGQALAQSGYLLVTLAAPLACAILLAVTAVLGLLAFRWELRRA